MERNNFEDRDEHAETVYPVAQRQEGVHPLDADDDYRMSHTEETRLVQAHPLILWWSVRVALGGFAIAFLAGVMRANYAAQQQTTGWVEWLFRLAMMLSIVGCCGILVAYRWKSLTRWRSSDYERRQWFVLAAILSFIVVTLVVPAVLIQELEYFLRRFDVISWVVWLSFPFAALLAVVACIHSGQVRGFAIGAIVPLLLLQSALLNGMLILWASGGRPGGTLSGGGRGALSGGAWESLAYADARYCILLVASCGTVGATYVTLANVITYRKLLGRCKAPRAVEPRSTSSSSKMAN
ncbi:MAG: hypothetical protein KatS3mg111_1547 [Pirellulaceae bacterium]|nr:MAG: hypothetical protein KatS3mg111_1547 [Pirellulaceae bacterium]